jgi:hypothetical protein
MSLPIDPASLKRRESLYRQVLDDPAQPPAAKNAARRALLRNLQNQRLLVRYPELAPKAPKPKQASG